MDREKMLTEIIQKYGFEHKNTIKFAAAMETASDEKLKAIYDAVMG